MSQIVMVRFALMTSEICFRTRLIRELKGIRRVEDDLVSEAS